MGITNQVWIKREYEKCSGCRRCEIICSLHHEGKIWPEASRVRIFMLVPGVEIPHLCFQCEDYPCIEDCPENSVSAAQMIKVSGILGNTKISIDASPKSHFLALKLLISL